eukprot:Gb_04080 [translate_table: standard]
MASSFQWHYHYHACYKFKNHRHIHMRFLPEADLGLIHQSISTAGNVERQSMQDTKSESECDNFNSPGKYGLLKDFNTNAYASLLQSCITIKSLAQVHAHMLITGLDHNIVLGTKLVSMYTLCGSLENARLVFDKTYDRNVFLWNAIIRGYARNGTYAESLQLYYQMQEAGIQADKFTFPFVLKACAGLSALEEGEEIHYHIVRNGLESDVYVGNALIDMYAKCGSIDNARQVFDKMPKRDLVSWTAMIAGYARNGHANEALTLFHQMHVAGVTPDSITIVSVLSACAHLGALQQGKWIHNYIIGRELESDVSVGNSLLTMYTKCGCIDIARQLFDKMLKRDVVTWNAMIAGYAQDGHSNEALTLFNQMQLSGMKPNMVTMMSVLPACAELGDLQQGKIIHDYISKNGFESDVFVGTALIDMYAKCGSIDNARYLFDKMRKRYVVSWNAMIAGYSQSGHANKALVLFNQMTMTDMKPNAVTMAGVLPACAHLGALQQGKWIHDYIVRNGFGSDVFVGTALIDMYAKCGSIEFARQVFDKMSKRDVVSWNAMIAGYGMHGHGKDSLAIFSQMQQIGVKPNHITFICVLYACSHAGLVDEGWRYFACMRQDYCIIPRIKHYTCMVDLLGRAGHLDEAQNFINKMPLEPDVGVWGALLGACRIHCNIELGQHVAEHLFHLQPENAGYYVLLSNIYAAAGRWDEVTKVRMLMNDRGLKKEAGCSFIELNNRVYAFLVGDRSHPQSDEIYATLETLAGKMQEAGYVFDTSCVLHNVEEEEKDYILCTHSEKLAIAFGLINTSPSTPIQITKNLRVCGDCHTATKFISKLVSREIIVRDTNRFHHFKDGLCSCGDYW